MQSTVPYRFYGANLAALRCRAPEVILSGPAETGKTLALLTKLHACALKYPGASIVIARKTQASTYSTVLVSWRELVIAGAPVEPYGGEKPEWYDYPNGSRVWITGMDKAGKILSGQHDLIYVNQAEELSLGDWETLTTRTTGRAGNMPYAQTIGDCNPAGALHWIQQRAKKGQLRLFASTHRDNPNLFDPATGEITEQGERSLATLQALTGARRKRLLLGEWASPEGLVYERFTDENVSEEADWRADRGPVEWAVDDGYSNNPRVILFVQVDDDGAVNVFDELYHLRHLPDQCAGEGLDRLRGYAGEDAWPEIAVCDPSAVQLMAAFRRADIVARGGKCGIIEGIQNLERFVCDAEGRRRLRIHPRCKNLIHELGEAYRYPDGETARGDVKPIKENDHGADALRYWAWLRMRRAT